MVTPVRRRRTPLSSWPALRMARISWQASGVTIWPRSSFSRMETISSGLDTPIPYFWFSGSLPAALQPSAALSCVPSPRILRRERVVLRSEGNHIQRAGHADPVLLVFGQFAGGAPAFGRLELCAVAADLAQGACGLDADFVQVGVDRVGCETLEDHVGGRVVAEHNHEVDHAAQGELHAIGKFIADDAAARYLVLGGDGEEFGPLGFAGGHPIEDGEQDGELDGAGGADGFSLAYANVLAGVEVLGVERDGSLKLADAGAESVLQGLGGQTSGNDKSKDGRRAHGIDDTLRGGGARPCTLSRQSRNVLFPAK